MRARARATAFKLNPIVEKKAKLNAKKIDEFLKSKIPAIFLKFPKITKYLFRFIYRIEVKRVSRIKLEYTLKIFWRDIWSIKIYDN